MKRKVSIVCAIVVLALIAGAAVVALGPRDLITAQNCERIREGITYDEVVKLLNGEPGPDGNGNAFGFTLYWTSDTGTIAVWFDREDRVRKAWFMPADDPSVVARICRWLGL